MGRKEDNIKKAMVLMEKPKQIRNIGIAAHIDHGKTTLSDNLIAGAGMMSEELAGKQLLLDFDEQEQDRGITINAANASMVHEFKGTEYLINLIDTPGHVDFGGDVTRAMRAVDGSIVVVCAVEGVMPQTETVIRQSLKERVKPILFINKVDRLINELKVSPEQMQQQFQKIIYEVDQLIRKNSPEDEKDKYELNVVVGSVAFGRAYHNWAISVPFMKESGISFNDIYNYCNDNKQKELAKKSPIHEVLLNMTIRHLPDPLAAQAIRIPKIWRGENDSDVGKAMINCNPKGDVTFMVTKIIMDPHAGEVAVGRLFSGAVKKGQELYVIGMPNKNRAQQVSLSVGADRIQVDSIGAGNIANVAGLRDAIAGSTISNNPDIQPFERIVHYSEPVVTVAIEAKATKDLPKLVEVLRSVAKADPSISIDINHETGESLMSGMGELHLEITQYRIEKEQGVPINASEPIVVYRESVEGKAGPFEGKSPNKHNRFYITVEPLEESVLKAIQDGEIPSEGKWKKDKEMEKMLQDLGWDRDEARKLKAVHNSCVLIDGTKGIQYLHETMELVIQAFVEAMNGGPLAREKGMGLKVILDDAKLHEDNIHRGPAQVIPAVRGAIFGSMCLANRILLEPMQKVFIQVPQDQMGSATSELQSRRGTINDMGSEGDQTTIDAVAPVAEMFGFASAIRGATSGRAIWSTENSGYQRVPRELQNNIVRQIRERKGLKPEPNDASYYAA